MQHRARRVACFLRVAKHNSPVCSLTIFDLRHLGTNTEGDCETVKLPNSILLKHHTQPPDSSQARLCGMVGLNKAGRIDKNGEARHGEMKTI